MTYEAADLKKNKVPICDKSFTKWKNTHIFVISLYSVALYWCVRSLWNSYAPTGAVNYTI